MVAAVSFVPQNGFDALVVNCSELDVIFILGITRE